MKPREIVFVLCVVVASIPIHLPSARAGTEVEAKGKKPWTIMLYGAVDNSADDPFVNFVDRVRSAIDDDPGIELIMFIDRSDEHANRKTYLGEDFKSSRLYRVTKDSAERLAGGEHFPEITKDNDVNLNSADASNLQKFITWGKANYPAERYGLLIYSHADGQAMCPDDRSRAEMGIAEVTDEVSAANRVDFLALELCNMGGAEIAYQWRPGNGGFEADVLLAIPNAGPPLDWHRAFARIRSQGHASDAGSTIDPATMTAADFGRLVIEEGLLGRKASAASGRNQSHEAAGCYDLREAGEVKKTVDALAAALATSDSKEMMLALRNDSSAGALMSYSRNDYVDLYDLCRRVAGSDRFGEPVRSAANEVMQDVDRFMIASFGMSHYANFEPGKNGVFIVLPTGQPNAWKRFRWYTPAKGDGPRYGNWSFLRDGATPGNGDVENWFELLESWFNEKVEVEFSPADAAADRKVKDQLAGPWSMQEGEDSVAIAFNGDGFNMTFKNQGREMTVKGKYRVDPSKQPCTMDMIVEEGPNEAIGQMVQCIYTLEGDVLTLCLDEPGAGNRPTAFVEEQGALLLLKLERLKD